MAKDRNTYAKRQREMEKKRKADEKRDRRAKKRQDTDEPDELIQAPLALSLAEHKVLDRFREYLMTPGKMLCFNPSDVETLSGPLDKLTNRGLLVAESHEGGYSLTQDGFTAMQSGDSG